jgi:hypothetical protein
MIRPIVNKNEEILKLSEEILGDLEHSEAVLESVLLKCKRLARLRNEGEAIKWFTLELAGYDDTALPHDIKKEDAQKIAHWSGRYTVTKGIVVPKGVDIKTLPPEQQDLCKDQYMYYIHSIPQLEALIKGLESELNSLIPPSNFTPAVNKSSTGRGYMPEWSTETVKETYNDVLSAITARKVLLQNQIVTNKSIVARVRGAVYSYVYNINLALKFGNITETIFEQARNLVNQAFVKKCPDAIEQLIASYDRVASNNPEEWSQALTSCRRLLKTFADSVFLPQKEPYIYGDKKEMKVGEAEYKNRIWAHIDKTAKGDNRKKILLHKVEDLGNRIDSIHDLASKGVHADIEQLDVNMCVIDTYLLLGTLLQINP